MIPPMQRYLSKICQSHPKYILFSLFSILQLCEARVNHTLRKFQTSKSNEPITFFKYFRYLKLQGPLHHSLNEEICILDWSQSVVRGTYC